MKVRLFYTQVCPFCEGPKEFIRENNLDVEMINLTKEKKYRAEVLKLGGKMQVPMLAIDDKAMYESRDILAWLEENKGKLKK